MSVKTILLPLSGAEVPAPVIETALRLAKYFCGHLDVLYVRRSPRNLLPYATLGLSKHMRESVLEAAEQNAETQADKARATFDEACQRVGVPVVGERAGADTATASWREETGQEGGILAVRGRLADLIVLPGPIPVSPPPEVAEAALKSTGRPVVIVPPSTTGVIASHIGIGWNGSAEAARAVGAAIPYLQAAESVTIFVGTAQPEKKPTSAQLVEYLGWHGVSAEVRAFEAHDPSVGEALLAEARDAGIDLLVVGGYSRSRLRELILGGVTGHLLAEADIPVFMVH
jgi:nucleotide-binding universal stress UspA family protein